MNCFYFIIPNWNWSLYVFALSSKKAYSRSLEAAPRLAALPQVKHTDSSGAQFGLYAFSDPSAAKHSI